MQPVQLCIFAGRGFKDAFENTQERKINRTNAISVTKHQAGIMEEFKSSKIRYDKRSKGREFKNIKQYATSTKHPFHPTVQAELTV